MCLILVHVHVRVHCSRALVPKTPTFPRTDRPTWGNINASQASKQAHVKSPSRTIRLTHTPTNNEPLHNSSRWQTGTSDLLRIPRIRASLTCAPNTAGVSSSASSSSSSSAPWHGSLAPRARTRRTSYPLLIARSHNTLSATSPASALAFKTRQATNTFAIGSVWRSTLILSAWSCWLMWGTYYITTNYTKHGKRRLLTDGVLCSYHFPRPVAPSHSARARRPPT